MEVQHPCRFDIGRFSQSLAKLRRGAGTQALSIAVRTDSEVLIKRAFGSVEPSDGGRGLRTLVRGISKDALDEGEEAACAPIEDEQSAVAILHSGRVDDTFNSRPSVSTRICRLRPVTFLAASKPCGSSVEPPVEPLWRFDCR